jgi:glycosyltransferase involved in cell wall biosynthesis
MLDRSRRRGRHARADRRHHARRFRELATRRPFLLPVLLFWRVRLALWRLAGVRSVCYGIRHDYFLDLFRPVASRLDRARGIRLYYSVDWSNRRCLAHVRAERARVPMIPAAITPFLPFDLFVTAEAAGPDLLPRAATTRTVAIHHGYLTRGFSDRRAALSRFDAHCVPGPQFEPVITGLYAGSTKRPVVYRTGRPATDAILHPDPAVMERLRGDYRLAGMKTVVYAPHWNPHGSLHAFGVELIRRLAALHCRLLVKPHHYLFTQVPGAAWERRLADLAAELPAMVLVTRPDTKELYPLADVLVTDITSSAPIEFALLGKPVVLYDCPGWLDAFPPGETATERAVRGISLVGRSAAELAALAGAVISGTPATTRLLADRAHRQRALAAEHVHNPGRATAAVAAALLAEARM